MHAVLLPGAANKATCRFETCSRTDQWAIIRAAAPNANKQPAIKEQRVIAICLGMINLTAVPIPSSSWCSLSLFQFSQLLAKFSLEIADHLCRRAVQGLFRQLAASGEFDFYCMLFPTSIHDCVMERFKNLARLFSTLVHLARKQASTRGGSSIGTIKRATNLFTASFLRRGTWETASVLLSVLGPFRIRILPQLTYFFPRMSKPAFDVPAAAAAQEPPARTATKPIRPIPMTPLHAGRASLRSSPSF
jgi:hypothetical protein